jgi:CheY-like chemotaxis protein
MNPNPTSNTILVVDDEPFMLRLLKYHLEKAGYATASARTGREAVALAAAAPPRLVVMDIMMADLDGIAALKALRENNVTRELPVIMITASANRVARQEAEANGATLFFTKPFSPTKLVEEVQRLAPLA